MVSKELEQKIDQFIAGNKQNILRDIAALVNIKSVSVDSSDPTAPFGEGCHKVLDTALEICNSMGFATKNYDYYAGSAILGSGEKEVALLAHLDVVPEGTGWSHDPYDMIEKDGYIYGRGVSDDKGPSVLGLYALKCLKDLDVPLKHTYRLILGCSEETGMGDLKHYLKCEKMPDFAFTPDADFPVCIGEKGIMEVLVKLAVDGKTIVGFSGGTVGNAVCARAAAELKGVSEADLGDYCHKTYEVEPISGGIKVTAIGKTSHAAKPEGSINATYQLCKLLSTLPQLSEQEKKAVQGVLEVLKDYNGAGLGAAVEDEPSGKLTHINGIDTLEDGCLVLNCNIRYPVTCKGEELFASMKQKIEGMGFVIEQKTDSAPSYRPADTPEVQALLRAYDDVTGEKGKPYVIGGGTYARHFTNAVAFGPHFESMPNPAGDGKGSEHMPDECTSIDYMMKSVKIYILSLLYLNELSL